MEKEIINYLRTFQCLIVIFGLELLFIAYPSKCDESAKHYSNHSFGLKYSEINNFENNCLEAIVKINIPC